MDQLGNAPKVPQTGYTLLEQGPKLHIYNLNIAGQRQRLARGKNQKARAWTAYQVWRVPQLSSC